MTGPAVRSPRRLGGTRSGDLRLARVTKALGHPARIRILRLLAAQAHCCHGSLVHEVPLAPSTISQHLRILREAGLIRGEVDGPRVCYCLNRDGLREIAALFRTLDAGSSTPEARLSSRGAMAEEVVAASSGS